MSTIHLLPNDGSWITARQAAEQDPARHDRVFDFSDFDEVDIEPIYDLGPRGVDADLIAKTAIKLQVSINSHPRAIVEVEGYRETTRARLIGWSTIPADETRRQPYLEEISQDKVTAIRAALAAAAPSGVSWDQVMAWWDNPEGETILEKDLAGVAKAMSAEGALVIRELRSPGSVQWRLVATAEHPLDPPSSEPINRPESASYYWPKHGWQWSPDVAAAIRVLNGVSSQRRGYTLMHPNADDIEDCYSQPKTWGQPTVTAEERVEQLLKSIDEMVGIADPDDIESLRAAVLAPGACVVVMR